MIQSVPCRFALTRISLWQKRRVESQTRAECALAAEKEAAALLAEEKRSLAARHREFPSLSHSHKYIYTDLAHFVPHSGHTYAVASRTSSKFTAREHAAGTDAPRRAGPLLFCTSSSLTHLLDCAITYLSLPPPRKRDRTGYGRRRRCVESGRGDEARCKGNDVYQLHPGSFRLPSAIRTFAVPHISLCWRVYF